MTRTSVVAPSPPKRDQYVRHHSGYSEHYTLHRACKSGGRVKVSPPDAYF